VRCLLLLSLTLVACDDSGKPPEDDVPADGKLDSFRAPTDHGVAAFGQPVRAELADDARYHAWTFTLSGPASIHTFTSRTPHEASLDTVIYLYKHGADGFGSYLFRNDDDGRSLWSSIDRDLTPGEYRVLVKGYTRAELGSFTLQVDCDGAGCAPTASCLFGTTYGEIPDNARVIMGTTERLTSPAGLGELDQQRIIAALHESTHTDVTTIEQAFAAADQHEINRTIITEAGGGRQFVAIEYGAGDNSYGAIFAGDTTEVVAAIHDGDLERCTVD
jgi:hypothetical protein